MTTPPRSYLFALVDGGGTVPPELGAVRRLVERGHRVTVLAEHSMLDEVRATGATYRPWTEAPNRLSRRPEHDPSRDWECKSPFQLFDRVLERQFVGPADAYATDLLGAVAEHRPDLVVSSFFAVGAMVGAEAAGLPYDVLFPNPYMLPAPGMPPFGLGLQPATGAIGRLRDRAVTGLTGRLWAKGLPRSQRRPRRAWASAAGGLLRPDPRRPPHPRVDVGRLRLPRRAARQRPLRRSGARRPRVGGRALDRPAG